MRLTCTFTHFLLGDVSKMDNKVEQISIKEGNLEKYVYTTKKKVDEINTNIVATALLSGWRYQGRGTRGKVSAEIHKKTTFTGN